MPALPELQRWFAAAILCEDAEELAGVVVADGLAPAFRVQVYRNHVFTSLTEALEATYPVVCRLVGRGFFSFAADRFIRRHPPEGPCLFEYGAAFPGFLTSFPPAFGHPYLGDVARLEWAMSTALHASDHASIEPAALASVRPEVVGRLTLHLDPSTSWLESRWPVDRIWRSNQPESDPGTTVDLATGPVRLEVRRRDDVVTLRRLEPAEFAFRAALGAGATLEAASDAALGAEADFDLVEGLRALLGEGLVTGHSCAPSDGEPDP